MRKFIVVVSVLMVASMVLAACAPKVTTTPGTTTEVPTVTITSPYIGSGKLDGNGVPPNFFSDVNIRKGFAYAFDWQTYINDVFQGEALQSTQLALPGMPGYDPNQAAYTLDLEKSAAAFQASTLTAEDGTSLWDTGFRIQMLYNQGNTSRQTIAEILAANLATVNSKFVIEILGLPWPAYLSAQRAKQIPIMTAGWLEDIHDPHNWYQPYTLGAYGGRSSLPADLKAQFQTILDAGVAASDPAERTSIYAAFNTLYYDQAVGVPLIIATSHGYIRKWIQGQVLNPIFPGNYFQTMSKTEGAKNPTTFTQATFGEADTLDPALAYDTASGEIIQNIYDTLVFYDGIRTDAFVGKLADSWTVSDDGKVYTFTIKPGVKFSDGSDMTLDDIVYSFVRGLLQGGGVSPQWLLSEPFFGVGNQDITALIDPNLADDREGLLAVDAATLKTTCDNVYAMFATDPAANTVSMTLAQPWGPFLATIAQTWGSVVSKAWVTANGGWDGTCETWQNFYAMQSADDPISSIAMGTGAYTLENWTKGAGGSTTLVANPLYYGTAPTFTRVVIQNITEWGTRFAEIQTGDADYVTLSSGANRVQMDPLVGEMQVYDAATNAYGPTQQVCGYDSTKLGVAKFTVCPAGQTGTGDLHLFIGRPGITMDVLLFNWDVH